MKHSLAKVIAGRMALPSAIALVIVTATLAASVAQADPGEVGLNNHVALRIRTNAAGWTIVERRTLVDQRLVHVLSYENTIAPEVRVSDVRGKPTIYVGDCKLITVYPQDAAANKTTMEKLAGIWAQRVADFIKASGPAHGKRIPSAPSPDDQRPKVRGPEAPPVPAPPA